MYSSRGCYTWNYFHVPERGLLSGVIVDRNIQDGLQKLQVFDDIENLFQVEKIVGLVAW